MALTAFFANSKIADSILVPSLTEWLPCAFKRRGGPSPQMHRLIRLFSTSIGRKLVLAVTGLMLLGFLLAHMLGNMSLFQGPQALNAYADWLQGHPLLWVMRGGLAFVFGIHVTVAIQLALENRRARSVGYAAGRVFRTSWASRYMVVSGSFVIFFVIYHLLHFTFGAVAADNFGTADAQGRHDVYAMVVSSFRNPWVCVSYVIAMNLVGLHLFHGARSLFQTVGINHESYNGGIRIVNLALIAIFVIGNCSIPILVYSGLVG